MQYNKKQCKTVQVQHCIHPWMHHCIQVLNPVKAWACTSGLECCPNSATLKDPLLDRTSWNTESSRKLPLMRQRTPAHGVTCTACWESSYKYQLVCQPFRLGRGCQWLCQRGSHYPNKAASPPVAGITYFFLQHWNGSSQDQRVKYLLLLHITHFFFADYRLLLIPSECMCNIWSFHWRSHEPKSQILLSGDSNWEHRESWPSYTKQH